MADDYAGCLHHDCKAQPKLQSFREHVLSWVQSSGLNRLQVSRSSCGKVELLQACCSHEQRYSSFDEATEALDKSPSDLSHESEVIRQGSLQRPASPAPGVGTVQTTMLSCRIQVASSGTWCAFSRGCGRITYGPGCMFVQVRRLLHCQRRHSDSHDSSTLFNPGAASVSLDIVKHHQSSASSSTSASTSALWPAPVVIARVVSTPGWLRVSATSRMFAMFALTMLGSPDCRSYVGCPVIVTMSCRLNELCCTQICTPRACG